MNPIANYKCKSTNKVTVRGRFQSRKMHGLSLIELMISITISLILVSGLVYSYTASRAAFQVQDAQARKFENGRFALEEIARDLRMASRFGCSRTNAPEEVNTQIHVRAAFPIMEASATAFADEGFINTGVKVGTDRGASFFEANREVVRADMPQGTDLNTNQLIVGSRNGSGFSMPGTGTRAPGTDAIRIIKTGEYSSHILQPITNRQAVVPLANQVSEITPNNPDSRLFVISDCQRAEILRAVINNNAAAPIGGGLNHQCANCNHPQANAMTKSYGTNAVVSTFEPVIYAIETPPPSSPVTNPRLVRYPITNAGAWAVRPEIVADGIDALTIQFGVSDDVRGVVDRWVAVDAVGAGADEWKRVIAVRVRFDAISRETVGAERSRGVLRQRFETTVQLRNHPQG
jgi:type IV pilus assembly protein PilW